MFLLTALYSPVTQAMSEIQELVLGPRLLSTHGTVHPKLCNAETACMTALWHPHIKWAPVIVGQVCGCRAQRVLLGRLVTQVSMSLAWGKLLPHLSVRSPGKAGARISEACLLLRGSRMAYNEGRFAELSRAFHVLLCEVPGHSLLPWFGAFVSSALSATAAKARKQAVSFVVPSKPDCFSWLPGSKK